jgi:tRNA pseudouridine38-40 synthase
MPNLKVTFSYNGKKFHGVAEQNDKPLSEVPTVVGAMREVFELVAQSPVEIAIAGRTDKGVHARAQVASVTIPNSCDVAPSRFQHVLNKRLSPDIVVAKIEEVEDDFHARHSAKARTYRYFIDNSETADVSTADFAWHVPSELNLDEMKSAAKYFVGEQDFSSVCRSDDSVAHNVREVTHAEFIDNDSLGIMGNGNLLCFQITANAFCWQMVRSIVGVLVLVGKGQIRADEIPEMLAKKERSYGGQLAPAHGLILWSVDY